MSRKYRYSEILIKNGYYRSYMKMHAAVSLKIDSNTMILSLWRLPNVLERLSSRFVDSRRSRIQGSCPALKFWLYGFFEKVLFDRLTSYLYFKGT